jgi:DNA-binding LacI/PurR family transcriptional regulator
MPPDDRPPATSKRKGQPRRTRLQDIAAELGVSIATVSRALSGEKGVRADLRERVIRLANAARYSAPTNLPANRVILAASGAAMVDYSRHQFTWHVLDGLRARAEELGFEIVTRPIAGEGAHGGVIEEFRDDPQVGGLMILTMDDEKMLEEAAAVGKSVVLVNGDDPYMRLSSVTPCNRSAARLATEHLIAAGHRSILFLQRPGRRTIERRREGWRDALEHHGLAVDARLVADVDDWLPELAASALAGLIEREGLFFTAVLGAADVLAQGALEGLKRLGLDVPGDVSVMGMDDLPQAAFLDPPLTTMHIPMRDIGAAALDLLRDGMLDPTQAPRRVELACPMVVRSSTAPVRAFVPHEMPGTGRREARRSN